MRRKVPDEQQRLELRRQLSEKARTGALALPDAIREMRLALGLTQEQFAGYFKLTRRQLQQMEADTGNPTIGTLRRIGHAFGFEVGYVPRIQQNVPAPVKQQPVPQSGRFVETAEGGVRADAPRELQLKRKS
jgi:transcriptional regulator with XRE-family HTH domain